MRQILLYVITILLFAGNGLCLCKPKFLNPITDVGWVNMFPIKIGGVTVISSDQPDSTDNLGNPVCVCAGGGKFLVGITVSMWEPYRTIDAIFDPGCFPSLGIKVSFNRSGHGDGGIASSFSKERNPQYFAQAHFIISPILSILNIYRDITCLDHKHIDFDVAYVTEVDPTWNDDMAAMILNPEVLLFANPITGMACMADAIKSTFWLPIDSLFWCMGSWESVYPLTGTNDQDTIIDGACTTAGRMIFKMAREGLMWDRAIDSCAAVLTPIWVKSHYRLQPLRPKAMTSGAIRIGQNTDTWAYKVFNPFSSGNWSFLLWRKIDCCLGVNPF